MSSYFSYINLTIVFYTGFQILLIKYTHYSTSFQNTYFQYFNIHIKYKHYSTLLVNFFILSIVF